ncbi:RICIN domain-containing protein [Streptomyces sp. NPDC007164]
MKEQGHATSTRHPATNKCLDAYGGGSANGTPLGIHTCTGAANQRWTLPA